MSWLTALFTDTQSPAHAALIYSLVIAAGMALGRKMLGKKGIVDQCITR